MTETNQNTIQDTIQDVDVKEDFSGFTDVSVKDPQHTPENLPPKIDVSEAVQQARAQETKESQAEERQSEPMMIPPGMMMVQRQQGPQRPSFWQTLMSRGLTIMVVVAIGLLVWWWWSSKNAGGVTANDAGIVENITNKVKKSLGLKLPPNL